jgi:hypothetical protein
MPYAKHYITSETRLQEELRVFVLALTGQLGVSSCIGRPVHRPTLPPSLRLRYDRFNSLSGDRGNMACGQQPGPICQSTNPQNVADGTLCRAESPTPGTLSLCPTDGPADFSWGYWDVVEWKVLPKWLGGDPDRLRNYKDAWVRGHRDRIIELSEQYNLPPELLGGVAWIEAGGKPYSSKIDVYEVRKFDHSGDPVLQRFTITKQPELTSMGPVAIQLRRAAEAIGIEFKDLSEHDKARLVACLQNADSDLAIVARHLWQLKQIDFPNQAALGPYEIRIVGARYNRGPDLTLQQILRDTSYGDFIVKKIYSRIQKLIAE